tara:strand:- start:184 stop:675 length:492 start_codon:yes stop_codon:yes gene_type:complete
MSKGMVTGIIILLPCLCLLVWLLWPSDEEQIRSQLEELCEIASKTEAASAISDAMVVKDFRKLFAPKITISIRSKAKIAGEHTDHELSQQYGRLRLASSRMGLGYDNLKFLGIEEQVARISVKFFASWTGKSGKTIREDAHTEVELKKIEGDWKFSQINYLKK